MRADFTQSPRDADYAAGQTFVQKWVIAILAMMIIFFIFPPAGLVLGFVAGLYAVRRAAAKRRERLARREHERYVMWRADPANQWTMPGNGTNGGLSIEERNAYRKQANQIKRR